VLGISLYIGKKAFKAKKVAFCPRFEKPIGIFSLSRIVVRKKRINSQT